MIWTHEILLQINSTITLHSSQREMHDIMRSQTEEMREMRELLHRALSSNELQNASVDIAEQLMAGGQNDLRQLRKVQERQFGDDIVRSTSPLPQVSDSQLYLELQRDLITLHRETGIPPTIKILDGEVKRLDTIPIAGGTYSDVWLGLWLGEKKVALKALRNIRAADPKAKKRFENEINMWAGLKNDHILPFYGIVTDMGQHIHMVSPWQENGNVLEYVKTHGDSNTRIRLIRGAAQGLAYLHSRKIIHGNMKCANILVTGEGEACICDFGMSKVIEEVTEKSASATLTAGGNARWMAPELIEGSTPTVEADTYSYAMAILELVTGKHPFADCKTTAAVIYEIVVHKRMPSRPEALQYWLSDGLWELLCACWQTDAASRPSMAQVTSYIQAMEEMAFA
uniref:Protein kinase domain-containing protein n=1 Tax=Psilocybe cubensis TaxID=181762 RepID=A0A8H7Y2H7_PSICU